MRCLLSLFCFTAIVIRMLWLMICSQFMIVNVRSYLGFPQYMDLRFDSMDDWIIFSSPFSSRELFLKMSLFITRTEVFLLIKTYPRTKKIGLLAYTRAGKSDFINLMLHFFQKTLTDQQAIANTSLDSLKKQTLLIITRSDFFIGLYMKHGLWSSKP